MMMMVMMVMMVMMALGAGESRGDLLRAASLQSHGCSPGHAGGASGVRGWARHDLQGTQGRPSECRNSGSAVDGGMGECVCFIFIGSHDEHSVYTIDWGGGNGNGNGNGSWEQDVMMMMKKRAHSLQQGRVMRRLSVQFDALSFEGTCELWDSARKWVDQQMHILNVGPGGGDDMDMDMDMDVEDKDDGKDNDNNEEKAGEALRAGW